MDNHLFFQRQCSAFFMLFGHCLISIFGKPILSQIFNPTIIPLIAAWISRTMPSRSNTPIRLAISRTIMMSAQMIRNQASNLADFEKSVNRLFKPTLTARIRIEKRMKQNTDIQYLSDLITSIVSTFTQDILIIPLKN